MEADETVDITLTGIVSGDAQIDLDGDPLNLADTVTIVDNDSATVSISADADGVEGGVDGQFTVTQTAISSTDTVVSYLVSGTATAGNDYAALSGSALIVAGTTFVTIEVPVLQDTILEANETVVVTLSGVSGDDDITLDGSNDEATVTIDSDDLATITVADLLDVEADLASNAPVVTYT